jgi:hypothetical protein
LNRSRDFLVGLTFFGLLAVLGTLTVFLGDFRGGDAPSVTVAFDDVGGLSVSARVRVDGLDSGRVSLVERRAGESRIHVTLSFENEPPLHADATFAIASASPLGGRVVLIRSGDPARGEFAVDEARTWPGPAPNVLDAAGRVVEETRAQVSGVLADIRLFTRDLNQPDPETGLTLAQTVRQTMSELRNSLGAKSGLLYALMADEELRDRFVATLGRAESIATKLDQGDSVLWAMLGDEEVRDDFRNTLSRMSAIATRLDTERGTFHKLVTDPGLFDDLRTAAAFARRVLSEESGFGAFLADQKFWDEKLRPVAEKLSIAADNLARATESFANEKTLIGMLLVDESAGAEVRNAIASLSDFIETTRENAPITTFAGILLSPF